jgi:hypothetical protein
MPDPTKTKEERENFFVVPLFHKTENLFIFGTKKYEPTEKEFNYF